MKTKIGKVQRESLVRRIRELNPRVKRDFLESLNGKDLACYLRELQGLDVQELQLCR